MPHNYLVQPHTVIGKRKIIFAQLKFMVGLIGNMETT